MRKLLSTIFNINYHKFLLCEFGVAKELIKTTLVVPNIRKESDVLGKLPLPMMYVIIKNVNL